MKSIYLSLSPILLGVSFAACAHSPKPYTFATAKTGNDIDVVVQTLQSNGLKAADIDRNQGIVTTYWFDTGYQFRETDIRDSVQYPTNIFLRYRINLRHEGDKETVVLDTDAKRCAPLDVTVTRSEIIGSCEPMTTLFPTQQKQAEALGEKLREALHGTAASPAASG